MTKLLWWSAVILWAGVIFFASHQPNLQSGFASETDFVLRKFAHMFVYGVLAFFLYQALTPNKYVIPMTISLIFIYALSDEYHQSFIEGRVGAAADVAFDLAGGALTLLILLIINARKDLRN